MQKRTLAWAACYRGAGEGRTMEHVFSQTERGREGGSPAVPSSWVIFNQKHHGARQTDLQPSHPPKKSHPRALQPCQPSTKTTQAFHLS